MVHGWHEIDASAKYGINRGSGLSYLISKLKNMEIKRLTDRTDGRMEGRRNKAILRL